MTVETILPSFRDFVYEVVRHHWDEQKTPLLLARVGQMAVARGYDLRAILGARKIGQFIQQELSEELELFAPPDSPSLVHAKPKQPGAAAPATRAPGQPPVQQPVRLNRVLWTAFARPLQQGYERRLQLEPYVRFWDAVPPLTEVAGRLPVPESYIVRPSQDIAGRRDDLVMENVRRWMRDNGLDIGKFSEGATSSVAAARVSAQNPLMLLIASLDEAEQKRVSLPLDVIAKLLRK